MSTRLSFCVVAVALIVVMSSQLSLRADHTYQLGDVFVGVGNGQVHWYKSEGGNVYTLHMTLQGAPSFYTTGLGFDKFKHLYVTQFDANQLSEFDETGAFLGVFAATDPVSNVESVSITRPAGTGTNFFVYVGQADGTRDILKFDENGVLVGRFDVLTAPRGTDWIDLATDQCTMYYTSEGPHIRRYDVCTNTQLADFTSQGLSLYALRIRPGGEVFAANFVDIKRFNSDGTIAQSYDTATNDCWFAMNMDPDNTSFWSADLCTGDVVKFDIASGAVLVQFNTGRRGQTAGLAIFGEKTASGGGEEEVCGVRVTQGGWGVTLTGSRGSFGGNASVDADGFGQGQQQYQDHRELMPIDFHSIVVNDVTCTTTHATITGEGRVKGVTSALPVMFTIEVEDLNEPGTGSDTYHITLAGGFVYDSGKMVLQGGNVQIHRSGQP